jgi:glucose-1-phosphate adenylyltransferase
MELVEVDPIFNLYNDSWPIYTQNASFPPVKFVFADVEHHRVGHATD